ncbi:MAG: S46 family peptidase [Thermoguttaceae bacterium]
MRIQCKLKFAAYLLQIAIIALLFTKNGDLLNADEGMWLFTNPPDKILQQRYGFTPDEQWLKHVQHSSLRVNQGGSASFLSADGLVMTNHHVGADALQKLSSAEHDYLRTGFYAKTREEELKCADQEFNMLESIEDVTARVNAAVPPGSDMAA